MDLVVFDRHELVATLRALRDVALENGVFSDGERDLVEAVARMHGLVVDARALEPIHPRDLAKVVTDPHKRKRVLQLAIAMSLVEGKPGSRTEDALVRLALALDVPERALRVIHEVANGSVALARFDMGRRAMGPLLRGQSIPKTLASLLPTLGLREDRALADRYEALARLAPDTFGHAVHDHYRAHGFALPGEKNGIPERGIFHDAGHVLSGYGVDPAGEIQQAAFQAGFVRNDGFVFFLFGILQFHLGLQITPIAKGETGFFDVKKVLRAAERGAACNVDLSDGWDFWSVAAVPLDEIRARYGVPPA